MKGMWTVRLHSQQLNSQTSFTVRTKRPSRDLKVKVPPSFKQTLFVTKKQHSLCRRESVIYIIKQQLWLKGSRFSLSHINMVFVS